jgi:hypothetical protein
MKYYALEGTFAKDLPEKIELQKRLTHILSI